MRSQEHVSPVMTGELRTEIVRQLRSDRTRNGSYKIRTGWYAKCRKNVLGI